MSEARRAFVNGRILTMDPALPRASAIVTEGESIAFVGDDDAARDHLPGAEVVDLEARTVIPGLIDGHCHLELSATHLAYEASCHAPPHTSLEEVGGTLATLAASRAPGEWVVGRGSFALERRIEPRRTVTRVDLEPRTDFYRRARAAGVEVITTPQFTYSTGDLLPDEARTSLATLHRFGFRPPGNSDSTGTQPEGSDPWHGIWCAVAHRTLDGQVVAPPWPFRSRTSATCRSRPP